MTDHFRGGTITSGRNQIRYYTYHLREGTSICHYTHHLRGENQHMSLHTSPQGREPAYVTTHITSGKGTKHVTIHIRVYSRSISLYIPEVTLNSCVWLLCSEGSCSLNTESGFTLTFPLHFLQQLWHFPQHIDPHCTSCNIPPPPIHTHTTHPHPHTHTLHLL